MPSSTPALLACSWALAGVLAGCGSLPEAELPAPAAPARSPASGAAPAGEVRHGPPRLVAPRTEAPLAGGALVARLDARARRLRVVDRRTGMEVSSAPAGVGPGQVACLGAGRCYVTDTRGDGLLVFAIGAGGHDVSLTRRVRLPGSPWALAVDPLRRRLWVTATGTRTLSLLPAHGRPHVVARFAAIRQPEGLAVDARTGAAVVTSPSAPLVQRVRP